MARRYRSLFLSSVLLLVSIAGHAQEGLTGYLKTTLRLLPIVKLRKGELTLSVSFAGGTLSTESSFYHTGWRYQNFSLSTALHDLEIFGKIYFSAREARYRKARLEIKLPLDSTGRVQLGIHHWAGEQDYSDSDEDRFGPWPCRSVIPWNEAWHHIGEDAEVEGPVVGYYRSGYLKLYLGHGYPHPDRFEVYIPASSLPKLEEAFGREFWASWANSRAAIRVRGKIKGYRRSRGGPRNGGYSVVQIKVTSASAIASAPANCGYRPQTYCPTPLVRWFEAHMYEGEAVWIQGPVTSVTGPSTYYGYPHTYRVRIGGGGTTYNRVEVILPYDPGWRRTGPSFAEVVCVYGEITLRNGVAVVTPPHLYDAKEGPCCGIASIPMPFVNTRFKFAWTPFEAVVDLGDCRTGMGFRRLKFAAKDLTLFHSFACDLAVAFDKCRGFTDFRVSVEHIPLPCCGIGMDAEFSVTPSGATLSFSPRWPRLAGRVEAYGDLEWSGTAIRGLALYGFGVNWARGGASGHFVVAFDPDGVEGLTDVTFYSGESGYLGLSLPMTEGCDGDFACTTELWFGSEGRLLGVQRVRFDLTFSVGQGPTLTARGQWDLSESRPLDWLDVGLRMEF